MRDTPKRDLAVARDLGNMADARIKELEETCADLRQVVRMCLQQFEFTYGKRKRGWDAQYLMARCEAVLGTPGDHYYCPEHKYNPRPHSGLALCPQCEIAAQVKEIRERPQYNRDGNCACRVCDWCIARSDIKALLQLLDNQEGPLK